MSHTASQSISKRELLTFLYKYRSKLVWAFFIPFTLFVLISFIPTPRYLVSSMLIVRLGGEYVYQPEVSNYENNPNPAIPFTPDQIFAPEVAILSSEDLHGQVIAKMGLDTLFPDLVNPTGLAYVIAALRDGMDKVLIAVGIEDAITQEQVHRHLIARAVELFDKRFDILLEKESAVIDLSYQHKDYTVAINTLNTLLTLYFEKRKQLYLDPRVKLAEAELAVKNDQAIAAARAVEDFKRRQNIYALDAQRTELLKQRAEAERLAMHIVNAGLQRDVAQYNRDLDRLDIMERELGELQKAAVIADDAYSLYSHKLDEARAYEHLQQERADSVRIIQSPSVPPNPRPIQLLIILGGIFLSILSTLGVAAWTAYSDNGFLTPEQIEQNTGLSVLAVLPYRRRA